MAEAPTTIDAPAITRDDLQRLLQADDAQPRLSLYMPTTRYPSEAQQNRIRFKDLLKQAEHELQAADASDIDSLLAPLRDVLPEMDFWRHQSAGLAVFRSPDRVEFHRVSRPIQSRAVVADSFHVKPLIRLLQTADRFAVLCVSAERVALYEGNRDELNEIPLHPDVPKDMAEALGAPSHVTKTQRSVFDFNDPDQRDRQLRRYFQRLDKAVWEHHARDSGVPFVLAALGEYHGIYQEVSDIPQLIDSGVKRDPFKEMDQTQLAQLAWQAMEPEYERRISKVLERFGEADSKALAATELDQVAKAAAYAQVQTLLIDEQKRDEGGRVDRDTGRIERKPIEDPAVDDLLDDIAELALARGAEVTALPSGRMPGNTGLAAIKRFNME